MRWLNKIDPAGLVLTASIPLSYWMGLHETARTACLLVILWWGLRPEAKQ